ncbi:DUF2971 domain-containing protein [Nitratidesulfovibrio liaohensis]|uniref:DUF2971 domain-containing protein n=1 Tax=Nitratidesulfovibrio liaohensis TaxID=2604158 RepID=UPI0014249B8A|nr:DUF2971 domain-containing protein [Nitratidesulfovibrio liaohensis]NHZ46125.1 DUF2971 domain-containing protein [Nitratidesulfovibrio liaohensis]
MRVGHGRLLAYNPNQWDGVIVCAVVNRIYKYRAINIQNIENLCADTLYFSSPSSFNDPFECEPTIESDSSNEELEKILYELIFDNVYKESMDSLKNIKIESKYKNEVSRDKADKLATFKINELRYLATDDEYEESVGVKNNRLLAYEIRREVLKWERKGICCFSTSCKDSLMWSHYADSHKGMCVGYDFKRNPVPQVSRVEYGGDRILKTSTIRKAVLEKDSGAKLTIYDKMFLRKARQWRYEKEYRIFMGHGLQESPLRMLDVTFGMRASGTAMYAVVSALRKRDNPVKFYIVNEVYGKFTLQRKRLDVDELLSSYPRIAQSGYEIFGEVCD